jgi:alpha-L-fucosidase
VLPITDFAGLVRAMPQTPAYGAYADAHLRELIARYRPSILWGDPSYPSSGRWRDLLAAYYNTVPDGVVNDRFTQTTAPAVLLTPGTMRARLFNAVMDVVVAWSGGIVTVGSGPHDFDTPEYSVRAGATHRKWETVRGLSASFGVNQLDDESTHLPIATLVHLVADAVAKNGNVLLGIGPWANGTVPHAQAKRLRALGAWLAYAGEGIYGTRPWHRAEATDVVGGALPIRYTASASALYALVLGEVPATRDAVALPLIAAVAPDTVVSLLTPDGPRPCTIAHDASTAVLHITLPPGVPRADLPALVLRVHPAPTPTLATLHELWEEARTPMAFALVATTLTVFFLWRHNVVGPPAPTRATATAAAAAAAAKKKRA